MRANEVGQTLLNVPMGEMISSMASAIAQAQWDLNKSSLVSAEFMSGSRIVRDLDSGLPLDEGTGQPIDDDNAGMPMIQDTRVHFGYSYLPDQEGNLTRVPQRVSMLELGFAPVFYQFVDTIIEVKIAVSMQSKTDRKTQHKTDTKSTSYTSRFSWGRFGFVATGGPRAVATSVDANYANSYQYSVEGASLLRTKLAPVPPPSILEERIRSIVEQEAAFSAAYLRQVDLLNEIKALEAKNGKSQQEEEDLTAKKKELDEVKKDFASRLQQ